jgi:hypothetical protein
MLGGSAEHRAKTTSIGAAAGSLLGVFMGLLRQQTSLLAFGFAGAAAGAFLAWVANLALCIAANTRFGRRWLKYHYLGIRAVSEDVEAESIDKTMLFLHEWRHGVTRRLTAQLTRMQRPGESPDVQQLETVRGVIEEWMGSIVDSFDILLHLATQKPEYQFRMTLIVFGSDGDSVKGSHWARYSGRQMKHRTDAFAQDSIAYKVLTQQLASPHFGKTSDAGVPNRNTTAQGRYHDFICFRVNDFAVLSLDWVAISGEPAGDAYIQFLKTMVHTDLVRWIAALLKIADKDKILGDRNPRPEGEAAPPDRSTSGAPERGCCPVPSCGQSAEPSVG